MKAHAKMGLTDRIMNDDVTVYDLKLRAFMVEGASVADSVIVEDQEKISAEGVNFDDHDSVSFDYELPPRGKRLY